MADMRSLIETELQDMRKLVGLEPSRDGNYDMVSNGTTRSDGISSMDTSYRWDYVMCILDWTLQYVIWKEMLSVYQFPNYFLQKIVV